MRCPLVGKVRTRGGGRYLSTGVDGLWRNGGWGSWDLGTVVGVYWVVTGPLLLSSPCRNVSWTSFSPIYGSQTDSLFEGEGRSAEAPKQELMITISS